MITTYFVVYYLIPRFLLTKKYPLFLLYSSYTLIFSTYLVLIAIFGSFIFLSNMEVKNMPPMSRNYAFILILVYLIVLIVSFVSILNHNFQTLSENKALENKILETQLQIKDQELQYLKKQIHPHFLFNTLNTIYGFALKQSKNTPDIILKLSNLLDYILYQVSKPQVPLKEEISHIKEYIELEKIRFQDTLKVSFTSDEISEDVQIAPMLLIPFVENAFKHGNLIDGFLHIDIIITFAGETLNFNLKNTSLPINEGQKENGIGLENLKKRLGILYKNKYQLNINQDKNWYTANLSISNLKETIHA
jgi:sensor histidine kinase YesM